MGREVGRRAGPVKLYKSSESGGGEGEEEGRRKGGGREEGGRELPGPSEGGRVRGRGYRDTAGTARQFTQLSELTRPCCAI